MNELRNNYNKFIIFGILTVAFIIIPIILLIFFNKILNMIDINSFSIFIIIFIIFYLIINMILFLFTFIKFVNIKIILSENRVKEYTYFFDLLLWMFFFLFVFIYYILKFKNEISKKHF
jgi:hypothetical protein